ncbi:MAG: hypothetical protein P8Y24_03780 [Gammaproteobacteria bacterium]|jgi:hypothetical protein
MNIYALIIGLIIVAYVIVRFKKTRLEKTKWAYPLFLASFPLYYVAFSIYGNDLVALWKELIVGIIFFFIAYIAYKSHRKLSFVLVGIGCILHVVYDLYHDVFFINTGTPDWWLEFCGSIDLVLGLYLIYIAVLLPNKVLKQSKELA